MKDAIATSTRARAKEVGRLGIRVNGVAPGLIATRFHDTVNTPDGRRATVEKTPLRREGTPGDVAELVLFLASDRASGITGEIVHVNGGLGLFQGETRTAPRSRPPVRAGAAGTGEVDAIRQVDQALGVRHRSGRLSAS